MRSTKIASLHDEYSEMISFCRSNKQVSFEMYINDIYKKSLLLSAASYFEATITKSIHDYINAKSRQSPEIVAFVDNKAIKRQYHTFLTGMEIMQISFLDYLVRISNVEHGKKYNQEISEKQKLLLLLLGESETD